LAKALSIESKILMIICLADMISTAVAVAAGLAVEQNPLMAVCLERGVLFFIAVKLLSFLPFVIAVEYYRRANPTFSRGVTRLAIALYVLAYAALTLKTNLA
jgi:hypothetical protein